MSSLLDSISAQHNRISSSVNNSAHTLTTFASSSSLSLSSVSGAAMGLNFDNELLGAQVSQIYDGLQRVQHISKELDAAFQSHSSAFKNSVILLEALDKFGNEARAKVTELDELELAFEDRKQGARFLFEELSNLIAWYELFFTAYDELLLEIRRRHQELQRQQEMVNQLQAQLDSAWTREVHEREHFLEFHGRYLPRSLCPAIVEPLMRRQIVPTVVTSELPVLRAHVAVEPWLNQAVTQQSSVLPDLPDLSQLNFSLLPQDDDDHNLRLPIRNASSSDLLSAAAVPSAVAISSIAAAPASRPSLAAATGNSQSL